MPEETPNTGIDYNAMASATAQAVAAALVQSGVVGQPRQGEAPSTVSEFQKKLEEIEANPESDKATVQTLKSLFSTFQTDLVNKLTTDQSKQMAKTLKDQRDTTARTLIDEAVRNAAPEGSVALGYVEEIRAKIIRTFNETQGDKDIDAARRKYEQGEIDTSLLKRLAKEEVGKFGATPPQSRSSAGMSAKDKTSETQAAISSEAGDAADNIDPDKDLSANERQVWESRMRMYQTMQPNGHRTKEARQSAWKAVQNMRNKKQKAS